MKKRYNDGGLPDYEREPSDEDKAQQGAAVASYKMEQGMDPNKTPADEDKERAVMAKPLAKASFKEAFAEARKSGDKTFEYMGKKYTTETAPSTPKTPAKTETKTTSSPATPKQSGFKAPPRMSAEDRVKKERGMKAGGSVSSASKRADGCAIRGKTRA
jgi:hypothetical protein